LSVGQSRRPEILMLETKTGGARWTRLIDDIVAGRWIDPESGRPARVPYDTVVIADDLDGAEADLVAPLRLGRRLGVVSDERTRAAMGARVEKALAGIAEIEPIVFEAEHADEDAVARLKERTRHVDGLVAVGSGTINDLCKYVTFLDGRSYCVFGTAPSMNGYTSTTASITLASGLKVSLKAHAPKGVFIDLTVNAAAPTHLIAAGFGDCLCRSTAQVDWWLSKRLLGTDYRESPFIIQREDEAKLLARAAALKEGDRVAVGYLQRVLTLCGLGVGFTGTSHHGSMAEHQISHYIDCFAGERHPGTLHGQQVGVASMTMARLQQKILASDAPPVVGPTVIDEEGMRRRYGDEVARLCLAEHRGKALDEAGADAMNRKLEAIWPELRRELLAFTIPAGRLVDLLTAAGGPTTAAGLGLDPGFYREAVTHAREMRNRFSMLDLADDAGLLADFVAGEG
jgi:glycerol-1-phosphate dehydrogenase [NAD(P)+]